MTEQEWLKCTDPSPMLEFLRGKASDRKLRLFAVACCRRVWHLFDHDDCRNAVDIGDRYADGQASDAERLKARSKVITVLRGMPFRVWVPSAWGANFSSRQCVEKVVKLWG